MSQTESQVQFPKIESSKKKAEILERIHAIKENQINSIKTD